MLAFNKCFKKKSPVANPNKLCSAQFWPLEPKTTYVKYEMAIEALKKY